MVRTARRGKHVQNGHTIGVTTIVVA
jgi:hypothetical protein